MKKHKVYIDGEYLVVEGDFISLGISEGISPYDIAEYESLHVYLEGYRQLYNKALSYKNKKHAKEYGEIMNEYLEKIRSFHRN